MMFFLLIFNAQVVVNRSLVLHEHYMSLYRVVCSSRPYEQTLKGTNS